MNNQSAVTKFIEQERANGTSDQDIQHKLLDAGWQMDIIRSAMSSDLSHSSKKITVPQYKLGDYQPQIIGVGVVIVVLMLLAIFI